MPEDSQTPDLSNIPDPSSLPPPRPAAVPGRQVDTPPTTPPPQSAARDVRGPGGIPPKHMASLQDSEAMVKEVRDRRAQEQVEQNIPRDDGPGDEPYHGHSFLSAEDAAQQIQEDSSPQSPPTQPRASMQPEKAETPQIIREAPPRERRDIRELFTTGHYSDVVRVAGYDLKLKTVSADEYTRAWAMACMMPEGTARDVALRQYLLAFACTHINDELVENLCTRGDFTDDVSKRANVFSRLDNELVRKFFEEGYLVIRQKSLDKLEKIDEEADSTANFTQMTR